jgi:hypothetical protein
VTGSPFPHDKVVPGLALPLGVIGVTARAPAPSHEVGFKLVLETLADSLGEVREKS